MSTAKLHVSHSVCRSCSYVSGGRNNSLLAMFTVTGSISPANLQTSRHTHYRLGSYALYPTPTLTDRQTDRQANLRAYIFVAVSGRDFHTYSIILVNYEDSLTMCNNNTLIPKIINNDKPGNSHRRHNAHRAAPPGVTGAMFIASISTRFSLHCRTVVRVVTIG